MRSREPCQHGIGFNQGGGDGDEPFVSVEPSFEFRNGPGMVFVPGANGRYHATGISNKDRGH